MIRKTHHNSEEAVDEDTRARKRAVNDARNRALRHLQVVHPDEYQQLHREELAREGTVGVGERNRAGYRARTRLAHLFGDEYHRYIDEERALLGLPPLNTNMRPDGPAGGRTPTPVAPLPEWLPAFVSRYGRRASQLWDDLSPEGKETLEHLLTAEGLVGA